MFDVLDCWLLQIGFLKLAELEVPSFDDGYECLLDTEFDIFRIGDSFVASISLRLLAMPKE